MKKSIAALLIVVFSMLICPVISAASDPDGPVNTVADVLWFLPTGNKKWVITSYIGHRDIGYGSKDHHGIDLGSVGTGTDVLAARAGTAYFNGYSETGGYSVTIDHGDGFYTKYQHLSKATFSGSKPVKAGDTIGKTGGTGHSGPNKCYTGSYYKDGKLVMGTCKYKDNPKSPHTGYLAHLHFEIAYCSKGSGYASEYGKENTKVWKGQYKWGTDGWVVYNPAVQKYTTDKNDPRLQKYTLTDERRYYCRATTNVECFNTPNNNDKATLTIKNSQGIIVVGKYTKDGQTWWKTEENNNKTYWIKSQQITNPKDTPAEPIGQYSPIDQKLSFKALQIKYPDGVNLKDEPYADGKNMVKVGYKDKLQIKGLYKNKYDNYWLGVEIDGRIFYICANNVSKIVEAGEDVTINGKSYPTGIVMDSNLFPVGNITATVKKNDGFNICGTVSSPYVIKSAQGFVYTGLSFVLFGKPEKESPVVTINKTSFNLKESAINKRKLGGIPFKELSNGAKVFKLVIKYEKWKDITDEKQYPFDTYTKSFYSTFFLGNGDEPLPDISGEIKATKLTLSASSATIWIDETYSLKPTVEPANTTDPTVNWATSDASVATVENGKVKAVGIGTATITASTADGSDKKAYCTVIVKKHVTDVKVSPATLVLYLNETATLTPIISPSDASEPNITWSSSSAAVTVSNGVVTAKSVDKGVTITAKATDGSDRQGTCVVEVRAYVESVSTSGTDTVAVGKTIQLSKSITPSNAYNQTLTWTSSDTSIATVDENGVVKGIKAGGPVTITATAADRNTIKATKQITVTQQVTAITINGNSHQMDAGNTMQLTASYSPDDATVKNCTWRSDDETVATVTASGLVEAIGGGTVNITATATDGSGTTSAAYSIQVNAYVSDISLQSSMRTVVGKTRKLNAEVIPSKAFDPRLSWTSSDPSVVSVNELGEVTGLKPGSATITVTALDRNIVKKTCTVSVSDVIEDVIWNVPSRVVPRQLVDITPAVIPESANYTVLITARYSAGTSPTNDFRVGVIHGNNLITAPVFNRPFQKGTKVGIEGLRSNKIILLKAQVMDHSGSIVWKKDITVNFISPQTDAVLIEELSIQGTNVIGIQGTTRLQTMVSPANATSKYFSWKSSNESVATVNQSGYVTGLKAGKTTITAMAMDGSGVFASIDIEVKQIINVQINGVPLVYTDQPVQFTATVTSDQQVTDTGVTWSSSDTSIATVSSDGVVSGIADGTAIITATSQADPTQHSSISTRIQTRFLVADITLDGPTSIPVNGVETLRATISPTSATDPQLTWSSSNNSIASVDSAGKVTARKPGSVTITATAVDGSGVSASITIIVKQQYLVSITGEPVVFVGMTASFSADVTAGQTVSTQGVTWSSSNTSVATVNANGVVTGISNGTAIIRAVSKEDDSCSASYTIDVQTKMSSLALSGESSMDANSAEKVTAIIQPATTSNQQLIWSSTNNEIATIDQDGAVIGLSEGDVTIKAESTDGTNLSASLTIHVYPSAASVEIAGNTELHPGETEQWIAVVLPDNARNRNVIWSSSDTSVVTVNEDGLVTAIANGTAEITAASSAIDEISATKIVTVTTLVSSITLTGTKAYDVGNTGTITATVSPATATNREISWSSSNTSVAIVNNHGVINCLSDGTATITAAATDGSNIKKTIKITVYPLPNQITISGESHLLVGTTSQLTATVLPENVRNKNVTWTSSNTNVATVSATGTVTPVGNGTTTITATSKSNNSVFASHEMTVTTQVASLTLDAPETIDVGESGQVIAVIQPATASDKTLKWTSSDESVAVIDASGNISSIKEGYVTITAETTDGSDIAESVEVYMFQKVQSISIELDDVVYLGQYIYPDIRIYPEDASNQYVTWSSSNENIVRINDEQAEEEIDDISYSIEAVGEGIVRLTATATDGSNVSGFVYVQVANYTELNQSALVYNLYTTGTGKNKLGTVSLTSGAVSRLIEDGYGAVWSVEHVSGDYTAAIGIAEQNNTYNGRSIASAVDLNLLRINNTGSDVYRVHCTVNGFTDTCTVTVNVSAPAKPLPESVSLQQTTYYASIDEEIPVNITPVCAPSGSELPSGYKTFLYGVDSFYRYADVLMGSDVYTVKFNKAGTYTANIAFYNANFEYYAPVTFVITNPDGTVPAAVEELTIDNSVIYLLSDETRKLEVNISPTNADTASLTWSSSDSEVATVDQNGLITAVGRGYAIITVSSDNGISANAMVYVTDSLLSIDWDENEVIQVFLEGNTKTVIQNIYLTPRASATISGTPTWTLKRKNGNNLTLMGNPITTVGIDGSTVYGYEIILKSVSALGITEYELTCTDGTYTASTIVKVEAKNTQDVLPTMINWQTSTFTGNVDQLLTIYPNVQTWPTGTSIPDEVTISFDGDEYWNQAINSSDFTVSRNMMTVSFSEPGVYTANCIYSCANMRYLVPVTFRIQDASGNVPVRAMKLTLSDSEISVQANGTYRLTATIAPSDATNKSVTWSSADTSIARVNASGLITGVANGRTTITCTPADSNCAPAQCVVVVEDEFTVTKYTELPTQYLQGEAGYAIASFELSAGTAKRLEAEGLTASWTLTRISGNAATVELQERNGRQYAVVSELLEGGTDNYQVTCTAGTHTWSDQVTLQVNSLGTVPDAVTIAQTSYEAAVGEEIELDFTPVCTPSTASIPSSIRATYVGIGDFYNGLEDAYRTSVLIARGDTLAVAFKKPGVYLLTRVYRGANLHYVTECAITVSEGDIHLLNCTDVEPVVYVGGKSSIASTCVIADSSIEELYGNEIVWNAERLYGDCLTVALRADQSSASLYVVNAKEWGEETWRVSCTFRGITDYVDITIHAVEARTELPESIALYQNEFSGMIGNAVEVPLAVQCSPEGTTLPSTDTEAWSFSTDWNTRDHASWAFADNKMQITFTESGYYGGRLVYQSGNVTYSLPVSFAITDEESVQAVPTGLIVSLNKETVTIYPEGETNVAVVNAILSKSDAYTINSVAAYAEQNHAAWSLEVVSGTACTLSLHSVNASSVQLMVDSISGAGDVTYTVNCSVSDSTYTAQGTIHVAASGEARPQPEVRQTYYVTPTGTVLTIDASFYDKTTHAKLCSGVDSIWDNTEALAAMGFEYETQGDLWMPTFYEAGTYTTTISNMVGNLRCSQAVTIAVYTARNLPAQPSTLSFPRALREIDDESFEGISVNVIDLRGTNVKSIHAKAFADIDDLMRIYIPSTVTSISSNAFAGNTDFVIYCVQGSYTDTWAQQQGYPVIYID